MGNICPCAGGTERTKVGAFTNSDGSDADVLKSGTETESGGVHGSNQTHTGDASHGGSGTGHPRDAGGLPRDLPDDTAAASEHLAKVMADTRKELERQRALREEQARLDSIVSTAGRDMVPVARGTAVPMGYYDPSYAHASAQALVERGMIHLCDQYGDQKEVAVAGWVPRSALPPGDPTSVVEVLSRGRWHGIHLDKLGDTVGVTSASADHPEYAMDELCETFLAEVVPTKDKLFQGCLPIVENLP
uniref:Uncharacterized protein n=1 Tax=Ditylum brightwellii TaxID=49249 RepID=A0A6S8Z7J7_9STRA|mmetsp:Transcript_19392/g.28068  ORF Transcript_19392/g.28068 Transcript_19392/m.28068 type:complete len:247 (-) Transcript_19392:596-1336(-)